MSILLRRWWLLALMVLAVLLLSACAGRVSGPTGWSGLTLDGDILYIGSGDGRVLTVDLQETARDRTAQLLFPALDGESLGAIYGPPAVHEGLLYVGDYRIEIGQERGALYAIKTEGGAQHGVFQAGGAIVGGPVVAEDKVLFGASDGYLYALDIQDLRRPLWTFKTDNKIWSTPTVSEGVVYFGSLDHTVYAVDLETGTEVWRFETDGAVAGQVLVEGQRAYVGSVDRNLYALDAATGNLLWTFSGDNWFWAGPVSDGNLLHAGTLGGTLYAVDLTTGQKRWEEITDGRIVARPVYTPEGVAVVTDSGRLFVFDRRSGQGQWLNYEIGDKVRAQIVTSGDGVLYVSDLGKNVHTIDADRGTPLFEPLLIKR